MSQTVNVSESERRTLVINFDMPESLRAVLTAVHGYDRVEANTVPTEIVIEIAGVRVGKLSPYRREFRSQF